MRSSNIASLLLSSTSLVGAVPYARSPAHALLHQHSLNVRPLAGRSIVDGKCGGSAGSCGAGFCCSKWGYCGITADYCGSGCQSSFGTCSNNDSAVPNKVNQQPPVSNVVVVTSAALAPAYTGPLITFTALAQSQVVPTNSAAAAATTAPAATYGSSTGSDVAYKMYTGDGSLSEGWPAQNSWIDFDTMWNDNLPAMSTSCGQWNQVENTDENNNAIKSAIETESASCGVDKRFILAIVMQESEGCVRVPTTFGSIANPGLMQSHGGSGTCFNQAECPDSEILQMIQDGTAGTPTVGLQECIAQAGTNDASKYYMAARIYNSGSIDPSGDLGKGVATHCYSSDIANRLMGWVQSADTPRTCYL